MEKLKPETRAQNLLAKVVVITGASSGAGRAAAIEFAAEGAKLVLAARRPEALNALVEECTIRGTEAIAVETDVTDPLSMKQLAQAAFDFGGRIDVWINNAGVLAAGEFNDTPVEVHDQVIKTNLMGYIHGAYAVMPFFKSQRSGVLVNNISVGGFFPTPYAVGYSASKFGLRGFSQALKGELISWPHIHICDLYPAFLDTPGIQHSANYTGKVLRPAPPVYDPQKVARAMVKVVLSPRQSSYVGGVAYMLRAGSFLMPRLMRSVTARVMQTYLKNAQQTTVTSGNVFNPVSFGTSIHGGWDKTITDNKKNLKTAMVIGGLLASLVLFSQVRKKRY